MYKIFFTYKEIFYFYDKKILIYKVIEVFNLKVK